MKTTKNNVKTVNLPPKRFNLVDFYLALIQTETPGSPQHVAAVAWFRDTAKLADLKSPEWHDTRFGCEKRTPPPKVN